MNPNSPIRRPFRYTNRNVAVWLIAINVCVFAFEYLFPVLRAYLAMTPILVLSGWVWQPFTYMFAHWGVSHLLGNMLGLFIFGIQVERELGSKEFLLYYLLTGFLAGVFSFVLYLFLGGANVPLLGASGAVFAVLLAFATIHPQAQIFVWGILPMRAPVMVLAYAAFELVLELSGSRDSVAHLTHLAGFGIGWVYFLVRFGVNPAKRFFPRR